MRKRLFRAALFAGLTVALASCVKEEIGQPLAGVPDAGQSSWQDDDVVSGWVRIKLKPEAEALRVGAFTRGAVESGDPRLDEIAQELGVTQIRRVFLDGGKFAERRRKYGLHLWYDLKIDDSVPVTRAERSFGELENVQVAQPIRRVHMESYAIMPAESVYEPALTTARQSATADEMPFDDPDLAKQWHYHNDGSIPGSIAGADINLFEGWKVAGTYGDPEVIVAVMDHGVQYDHPDLAANMWVNPNEIPGNGIDDDGNGVVDDIHGANFMVNWSGDPEKRPTGNISPGNHGTHVAGTIAAVNGNDVGCCGVAGGSNTGDGVRLMTLQFLDERGSDDIPMLEAFAYAADMGAVIVNCSWTINQTGLGKDTSDAIQYFVDNAGTDENGVQDGPMKGGLVVCAAGNTGSDMVYYPARDARTVAVASMTPFYEVADYSEYGESIDLLAPGGANSQTESNSALFIYSTLPNGRYGYMSGTSMACPHVSGVAALILSKYKAMGFTAADLRRRLEGSVRPIGDYMAPKYSGKIGNGLVDVALMDLDFPTEGPSAITDLKAEATAASVTISFPVPIDGNGMPVAKYNLEYAEVVNGVAGETQKMILTNNFDAGERFVYVFQGKSEAEYKFRINAVDRYGNETEYVEFQSATDIYENHAPQLLREFSDVTIEVDDVADLAKNVKKFILNTYFKEPDTEYGDAITYSFRVSDESVVAVELLNGLTLQVTPLKAGTCTVTVVATDKRGAAIEAPIFFTIKAPEPETPPAEDPDDVELRPGLNLYPNPVGDQMTLALNDRILSVNQRIVITWYDAAARQVMEVSKQLDGNSRVTVPEVSRLAPGTYTVRVTLGDHSYTSSMIKL